MTGPRSENGGAATAWNSSSIHPTPTPTVRRPDDSTSTVASALAASTAGRWGTTITEVTRRTRLVAAARKPRTVIISRHSPARAPGHSPVGV